MSNNFKHFTSLLLLTIISFSCYKTGNNNGGDIPQGVMAISYINGGPWHLISSTDIDINGHVSRYIGSPNDSINFSWGEDSYQNVQPTTISTNINGVRSQCNYQYILTNNSTPPGNNYIPFYLCTPAWKKGYSDTLFLNYTIITSKSAVFKVRYNINGISGIEIDSLGR